MRAPGNDAPIGGIKLSTAKGWIAARPSGTEEIYKIYAESFVSEDHLAALQADARAILADLSPSADGANAVGIGATSSNNM